MLTPRPRAERRHPARCLTLACAFAFAAALGAAWASGCDDSPTSDLDTSCPPGRTFNVVIGQCVALPPDAAADTQLADVASDATPDTAHVPDSASHDSLADTGVDTVDPSCDKDEDGALELACGGDDCDDENPTITPGRTEVCDLIDNNCDGQNNEDVDCSFFAHTETELYRIDPFARTATRVTSVPGLFDIDTHPDGTLYGITSEGLYVFDRASSTWILRGTYPAIVGANGLAIDSGGDAFVTAAGQVWTVELATAQPTLVGNLGGGLQSSGDCVFNKVDSLFMTAPSAGSGDRLVLIDRSSGAGTVVGDIGFPDVYGLTAAWGTLYGVTGLGQLVAIDRQTAAGTLMHTFPGLGWFGAASTPAR